MCIQYMYNNYSTEKKPNVKRSKKNRINSTFLTSTEITMDCKHKSITESFSDKKNKENLENELNENKQQRKKLLEDKQFIDLKEGERILLFNLENKISKLENELNEINSGEKEIDYYIKAMPHLYDYIQPESNKEKIHEKYMLDLFSDYVPKNKKIDTQKWCSTCNCEKIINYFDGIIICAFIIA